MKAQLLMFLIAFNYLLSFSQDWKPIKIGERLNYSIQSDSFYSTIFADSARINMSGDSIFYLNKMLQKTGHDNWYGDMYVFKSAFLLSEIVYINNELIQLKDTQSRYYLFPYTNLNQAWIFDSTRNITAKIIVAKDSLIFNAIDSIKSIELSTGDTIIISKNYGILKFPLFDDSHQHIKLIGIEGINVGYVTPYFNDVFNFQIGDIFEYQIEDQSSPNFPADIILKQYEILEKKVLVDTLFYVVSVKERKDYSYYENAYQKTGTLFSYKIDTIQFEESNYLFLDKTTNQFLGFNINCTDDLYRLIKIKLNPTFEVITKYYDNEKYYLCKPDTFCTNYTYGDFMCNWFNYAEYGNGIGLIENTQVNSGYYYFKSTKLQGYIKNGIKRGTISSDYMFTPSPVLITPTDNSTGLEKNIFFSWSKSLIDTAQYNLQLTLNYNDNIVIDTTLSDTCVTLLLKPHTQYYAHVRCGNSNNNGSWSTIVAFTTRNNLPVGYVFTTPVSNQTAQFKEGKLEIRYNPNPILDTDGDVQTAIIRVYGPDLDTTMNSYNNPGIIELDSALFRLNRTFNIDGKITDGIDTLNADNISFLTPFYTGIELTNNNISFNIYPNPTKDYINLNLECVEPGELGIVIYSMDGKVLKVLNEEAGNSFKKIIDVRYLNSGMYIMQIRMGDNIVRTKININKK